jgi:hypothetical protein
MGQRKKQKLLYNPKIGVILVRASWEFPAILETLLPQKSRKNKFPRSKVY